MAIPMFVAAVLPRVVLRFARKLRFPQLFLLMGFLFLLNLIVPDFVPLLDEILLGLATLLFASWKGQERLPDE